MIVSTSCWSSVGERVFGSASVAVCSWHSLILRLTTWCLRKLDVICFLNTCFSSLVTAAFSCRDKGSMKFNGSFLRALRPSSVLGSSLVGSMAGFWESEPALGSALVTVCLLYSLILRLTALTRIFFFLHDGCFRCFQLSLYRLQKSQELQFTCSQSIKRLGKFFDGLHDWIFLLLRNKSVKAPPRGRLSCSGY